MTLWLHQTRVKCMYHMTAVLPYCPNIYYTTGGEEALWSWGTLVGMKKKHVLIVLLSEHIKNQGQRFICIDIPEDTCLDPRSSVTFSLDPCVVFVRWPRAGGTSTFGRPAGSGGRGVGSCHLLLVPHSTGGQLTSTITPCQTGQGYIYTHCHMFHPGGIEH